MWKSILGRLLLVPIAVVAANLLGYAYALVARAAYFAQNPFTAQGDSPPFGETYLAYLQNALHLDFGNTPRAGQPVLSAALDALGYSLTLLLAAFVIGAVLGVLLGLLGARVSRMGPTTAGWLLPFTTVGLAAPSFYVGIFALAIASALLIRPNETLPEGVRTALPILALALRPAAQIAKTSAGLLVDEFGKQYVVTAKSIGNHWEAVRRKHVLPNVIAGVILNIGSAFRWIVAELIVVEWVFNWPGLGRLLGQTLIMPRTSDVAQAGALFLHPPLLAMIFAILAGLFMLADLVTTLSAQSSDPRLRAEAVRGEG